ncbi:Prolyl oligopeptidase family protein [Mucilaginibacter pineti]|uniref:Prolyl oligopeptidase family protein n=1 Tax=Mucilaginibacter pineti TaxID=1391627 RepID=A0A1G7IRR6_9SPHI|nr:prolyl oligopeptidase family serine peptidase [Mucilaginibacter pineti]SDF14999.1 Prolyl oligopeptidase family protein [Mucilaginibacter pineti]
MKSLFTFFLCLNSIICFAQKPVLDTATWNNWPTVGQPALTDDGSYVIYMIDNQPKGSETLMLKATNGRWEKQIPHAKNYKIIRGNTIVYQKSDSLVIIALDKKTEKVIKNISSYTLYKTRKDALLACLRPENRLLLVSTSTGKQTEFNGVLSYLMAGENSLLLKRKTGLYKSSFSDTTVSVIYAGEFENLISDKQGMQFAFTCELNGSKSIYYYSKATGTVEIADNHTTGIDTALSIAGIDRFSEDGKRIIISLKETQKTPKGDNQRVRIWSYKDVRPPYDLQKNEPLKSSISSLSIGERKVIQLQHENETVRFLNDSILLINYNKGNISERNWNEDAHSYYSLFNLTTNKKTEVAFIVTTISPTGKYALGYDSTAQNLVTINLITGESTNLTKNLPIPLVDNDYDLPGNLSRGLSLGAWLPKNKILVYDRYDIWKLDLTGLEKPECLTNFQGRKSNVSFRLISADLKTARLNNGFYLTSFDWNTKDNGFYSLINKRLKRLSSGSYFYNFPGSVDLPQFTPLKAIDKSIFLVRRESATSSQNYFITKDFVKFSEVSNVYPEKQYNWITAELVKFKSADGKQSDGVLYKPEDFDSLKRYPVIIHYYEKLSHRKNVYYQPEGSGDNINIPWFVSQGFLVFTPDIHYTVGKPGASALNYISGAYKELSSKNYVDSKRVGIMGHSFGGFETDYIVSHSNLFAAAVSSAGASDFIGNYGYKNYQFLFDMGTYRMGKTLWEDKEGFIDNSSVLNAEKVVTPILLLNNRGDIIVPFNQGAEFFTALRRYKKKVWLIEYSGENHSVSKPENVKDRTLNIENFFTFFLKGEKQIFDWK